MYNPSKSWKGDRIGNNHPVTIFNSLQTHKKHLAQESLQNIPFTHVLPQHKQQTPRSSHCAKSLKATTIGIYLRDKPHSWSSKEHARSSSWHPPNSRVLVWDTALHTATQPIKQEHQGLFHQQLLLLAAQFTTTFNNQLPVFPLVCLFTRSHLER